MVCFFIPQKKQAVKIHMSFWDCLQSRQRQDLCGKTKYMDKWTQRYRNWDQVLNQLIVLYGERLTNCLQRKEKQEWICSKADHSRFLSIPSAFVLLPEFPYSIPEVGCGQRPRKKQSIQCLICHAKKSKRMYKILSDGYTVNRKIDSTTTEL